MNATQLVVRVGASLLLASAGVRGQTLFWDADPLTAGAQGGTGNWVGTNFWFNGLNNVSWLDLTQPRFGGSAGTVTVNSDVVVDGMMFTVSGYTINGTSNVTLASPLIDVSSPALDTTAEVSAPLAGTAGLVKTGTGILILSGAQSNTYTGTTFVNGGTLFLSKTGATAINGDLVIGDNLGGGNLVAVQQFASNQIADSAKVTVNANASWTVFNQSETIGALELNGGTVQLEPPGTLSPSSVTTLPNSATAFLRGRVNLGGVVRTFNVANGAAATDLSMYPVAGGTDGLFNGGVLKTGAGTLELSGANTFDTLQINGGAISVSEVADAGAASPLGAGSSISFDGGTLVLTGASVDSTNRSIVLNAGGGTLNVPDFAAALGLSGVISGTGGLTKTGQGQLTLSGNSSFTGPLNLAGGQITITDIADSGLNSPIGAGSSILLSNNSRLFHLGANDATNRSITLSGSGGGIASATILELTGPIVGSGLFQKSGGGTVILSGVNTFTGDIFIGQSTLRVANGSAIPDTSGIDFNNGLNPVLDLNNSNETVGSLGNNTGGSLTGGTITLGTGTLTTGGNNRSTTYNGLIHGVGGSIVKIGTGTQTFTQPNTFTGPVTITGGAISVADVTPSGVNGPLGAGNSMVFGGGTLVFTGGANDATDRGVTLNAGGGKFRNTSGGSVLSITGLISGPGSLSTEGFVELTGANTFTGSIVIDGGILSVPSVANSSLTSPIGRGNSIVINNGAGFFLQGTGTHSTDRTVSISGGVSLSPGNGTVTFSGPITGTGGLNITGPGVLVLSGSNTFSGGVSVFNSTLRIANGNAIPDTATVLLSSSSTPAAFDVNNSDETIGALSGGSATSGAVTLGVGTLRIGANDAPASFDGVISGAGGIVKIGFGDFTMTRASTFTGSMRISSGTVFVGDVADSGVPSPIGAGGSVILGATGMQGTLAYTGTNNDSMSRLLTLSGSGGFVTVSQAAAALTIGPITGPGVLGITGPGTVIVDNTNNYTGATLIGQGTLRQDSGGTFSNASAFILSNAPGAVLDLNNANASIGSLAGGGTAGGVVMLGSAPLSAGADGTSTTFGGTITGTGGFTKTGTGTLTLSGTNTYSGVTSVNAGKLQFSGGNAIANNSPLNVSTGATAEFVSGTETIDSLLGSGNVALSSGNLSIGAGTFGTTFAGVISGTGNLSKIGPSTLTLTNAPTHTGTTTISGGTLALNGGFDSAGAAITIAAGAQLEARNSVSRPITGLGTITATGTLVIGDSNSPSGFNFGGLLTVGTQQVILADSDFADLGNTTTLGAGGRLSSINGIRLASGRSITGGANLGGSISGNLINNGVINGPAQPGQFLSLTGDVTGTGNYAGNLRFTDSFSPGNSAAAISLQNFLLDSTNTLNLEIGGLTAGSQYDRLNFTGTGTLDGILTITLISGFQPVEGNTFTILSGGTVTGAFDILNFPPISLGLAWQFTQTANSATLVVVPEPSTLGVLFAGIAFLLDVRFSGRRRRS